MDGHFSIPSVVLDSAAAWQAQLENGCANPFEQGDVVLTTYDFAAEKAEALSQIAWHMAVFEGQQ